MQQSLFLFYQTHQYPPKKEQIIFNNDMGECLHYRDKNVDPQALTLFRNVLVFLCLFIAVIQLCTNVMPILESHCTTVDNYQHHIPFKSHSL